MSLVEDLRQKRQAGMATSGTPGLIRGTTPAISRTQPVGGAPLIRRSGVFSARPTQAAPTVFSWTKSPLSFLQRAVLSFSGNDRERKKLKLREYGFQVFDGPNNQIVISKPGMGAAYMDEEKWTVKDIADWAGSVPTMGGQIIGAAAGTVPVIAPFIGGPKGGGAIGGFVGEAIEQTIAKGLGARDSYSVPEMLGEGALGVIGSMGMGKGATIARNFGLKKGITLAPTAVSKYLGKYGVEKGLKYIPTRILTEGIEGGISGALTSAARTGYETRDIGQTLKSAGEGFVFGGALGGALGGTMQVFGVGAIKTRWPKYIGFKNKVGNSLGDITESFYKQVEKPLTREFVDNFDTIYKVPPEDARILFDNIGKELKPVEKFDILNVIFKNLSRSGELPAEFPKDYMDTIGEGLVKEVEKLQAKGIEPSQEMMDEILGRKIAGMRPMLKDINIPPRPADVMTPEEQIAIKGAEDAVNSGQTIDDAISSGVLSKESGTIFGGLVDSAESKLASGVAAELSQAEKRALEIVAQSRIDEFAVVQAIQEQAIKNLRADNIKIGETLDTPTLKSLKYEIDRLKTIIAGGDINNPEFKGIASSIDDFRSRVKSAADLAEVETRPKGMQILRIAGQTGLLPESRIRISSVDNIPKEPNLPTAPKSEPIVPELQTPVVKQPTAEEVQPAFGTATKDIPVEIKEQVGRKGVIGESLDVAQGQMVPGRGRLYVESNLITRPDLPDVLVGPRFPSSELKPREIRAVNKAKEFASAEEFAKYVNGKGRKDPSVSWIKNPKDFFDKFMKVKDIGERDLADLQSLKTAPAKLDNSSNPIVTEHSYVFYRDAQDTISDLNRNRHYESYWNARDNGIDPAEYNGYIGRTLPGEEARVKQDETYKITPREGAETLKEFDARAAKVLKESQDALSDDPNNPLILIRKAVAMNNLGKDLGTIPGMLDDVIKYGKERLDKIALKSLTKDVEHLKERLKLINTTLEKRGDGGIPELVELKLASDVPVAISEWEEQMIAAANRIGISDYIEARLAEGMSPENIVLDMWRSKPIRNAVRLYHGWEKIFTNAFPVDIKPYVRAVMRARKIPNKELVSNNDFNLWLSTRKPDALTVDEALAKIKEIGEKGAPAKRTGVFRGSKKQATEQKRIEWGDERAAKNFINEEIEIPPASEAELSVAKTAVDPIDIAKKNLDAAKVNKASIDAEIEKTPNTVANKAKREELNKQLVVAIKEEKKAADTYARVSTEDKLASERVTPTQRVTGKEKITKEVPAKTARQERLTKEQKTSEKKAVSGEEPVATIEFKDEDIIKYPRKEEYSESLGLKGDQKKLAEEAWVAKAKSLATPEKQAKIDSLIKTIKEQQEPGLPGKSKVADIDAKITWIDSNGDLQVANVSGLEYYPPRGSGEESPLRYLWAKEMKDNKYLNPDGTVADVQPKRRTTPPTKEEIQSKLDKYGRQFYQIPAEGHPVAKIIDVEVIPRKIATENVVEQPKKVEASERVETPGATTTPGKAALEEAPSARETGEEPPTETLISAKDGTPNSIANTNINILRAAGADNKLIATVPISILRKKLIGLPPPKTPQEAARQGFIMRIIHGVSASMRAAMSTLDVSFGGRQGILAIAYNPKLAAKEFKKALEFYGSPENYAKFKESVKNWDEYQFWVDKGMSLKFGEELFQDAPIEKIPGVGAIVKASNRAYNGNAILLRIALTKKFTELAKLAGRNYMTDEKLQQSIVKLVNAMTGAANLPKDIRAIQPFLNDVFFSPKLMTARLQMLNPMFYVGLDPLIRKEALKTAIRFGGLAATVLALASAAGLEVESDPRSTDFAKIKIGNTRVDVLGGFQQYLRVASQLATGKVKTAKGNIIKLGDKDAYKPMTRKDVFYRFFENKEAPLLSLLTTLAGEGTDFDGNPISVPKEVLDRFTPMVIGDLRDIYEDDPSIFPVGLLGIIGIGTSTYGDKKKETKKSPAVNPQSLIRPIGNINQLNK